MTKLRVLSLFAGIGGFDLGLERTGGFETVAFCEIEPFAVRVLNKHWPEVPVYGDVRQLTAERLRADGIAVDVICGGFPCQDISLVGKGAGIKGERSGLWSEYTRLIGELRPRYVIVENVAALLGRGLGDVLGDLAALGYDAEWHCIPASNVGAPHRRDRFWAVAHPKGSAVRPGLCEAWSLINGHFVADSRRDVADPVVAGLEGQREACLSGRQAAVRYTGAGGWWSVEPNVGRVAHGVPSRVDRLRCLGNAAVPQIPELIGRAILASLEQERAAA